MQKKKWKTKNTKLKIKLNGISNFVFSYYIVKIK
jgi:hypothetical protein